MKRIAIFFMFAAWLAAQVPAPGTGSGGAIIKGTGVPSIACSVGDVFFRTDGTAGANLYFCTATNTWTAMSTGSTVAQSGLHTMIGSNYYFASRRMTPITTANWTSVNFNAGVTTRTDNTGAIALYEPNTSSAAWRMVCATLPSAPYTIRVHLIIPPAVQGSANPWAISLRNSGSGNFVNYGGDSGDNTFQIQKYTNPTTTSGAAIGNVTMRYSYGSVFTLQLQDDSTYRYYYLWDGFQTYNMTPANNSGWYTRVLNNDFIVPDQVCVGFKMTNGNYSNLIQLIGYDVNPSW